MPRYSDDEVRKILQRALGAEEESAAEGPLGLEHGELVAVAEEVGIEPEALQVAAAEVLAERSEQGLVLEARRLAELDHRRARRGWLRHLASYGVIMAGLVGLDLATGSGVWWIYPALGWGMGVALHGVRVVLFDKESVAERHRRRLERRRERQKRAREGGGALAEAGAAFEAALERGVTLLLHKAARKLDAATSDDRGLARRRRG